MVCTTASSRFYPRRPAVVLGARQHDRQPRAGHRDGQVRAGWQFCEQAVASGQGKKNCSEGARCCPVSVSTSTAGSASAKTHLLASSFFDVPEPKAFATFGELTQLAGVFGFVECIECWADYVVVCNRRVRAGRPGQHHADLPAAVRIGRARGVCGRDVEHAARAAR